MRPHIQGLRHTPRPLPLNKTRAIRTSRHHQIRLPRRHHHRLLGQGPNNHHRPKHGNYCQTRTPRQQNDTHTRNSGSTLRHTQTGNVNNSTTITRARRRCQPFQQRGNTRLPNTRLSSNNIPLIRRTSTKRFRHCVPTPKATRPLTNSLRPNRYRPTITNNDRPRPYKRQLHHTTRRLIDRVHDARFPRSPFLF